MIHEADRRHPPNRRRSQTPTSQGKGHRSQTRNSSQASAPDPHLLTPLAAKVKKPIATYRSGFFAIKQLDQRNSKESPGLIDNRELTASKSEPRNPMYRRFLRDHLRRLSRVELQLRHPTEAAGAARESANSPLEIGTSSTTLPVSSPAARRWWKARLRITDRHCERRA